MVGFGTLMAFAVVCAAVLVWRVTRPEVERPFRFPAVWVVGPLGIAVHGATMLFLPPEARVRRVVWLVIGLALDLSYGRLHSNLRVPARA